MKKFTGKKMWYLLAYDIRQPKRLQRTHYFIKKKAIGLQKSVYLAHADNITLEELTIGVQSRVHDRVDDVRLYPVCGPNSIWTAGLQAEKFTNLYAPGQPLKKGSKIGRFIKHFFRKKLQ